MSLKEQIKMTGATRVRHLYMVVADEGRSEAVCTLTGPEGEHVPVVAIDRKGRIALSKYAQALADSSGKSVSLVCFTRDTSHETFAPGATGDKHS